MHDYNELLIEHRCVLIDVIFLKSSIKEIKKMNNDKVGAGLQYSDSYVQFSAILKINFENAYRIVQGTLHALSEYVKVVE